MGVALTRNPDGAYGYWQDPSTDVTSRFSGYHGYWPISNTELDPRFGTRSEFDGLVDAAHDADMNFILDYVANHVHEEHPLYAAHPDWVTSLYLPDGTENTQLWDAQRLTTWFDTFMPTLDLRIPEVYRGHDRQCRLVGGAFRHRWISTRCHQTHSPGLLAPVDGKGQGPQRRHRPSDLPNWRDLRQCRT